MIEFVGVTKAFDGQRVVDDLTLEVRRGELLVLLGRSGSGKSTLLRLVNRLLEPDRGELRFAGRAVREFAPEALRRRIGYVIQGVGLFPHWSVARNVGTVPRLLGWPRERIEARAAELLALLGLDPATFGGRYPHELSGGQQQRVGVARALAAGPEALLMDEPFGALDPLTRADLQAELLRLQRASGQTVVFVTHDVDEALRLATRIVLIDAGRIVQQGTPAELLARPVNEQVAQFVGGGEAGLRLLALERVAGAMRAPPAARTTPLPTPPASTMAAPQAPDAPALAPRSWPAISPDATLRDVLALCVARQVDRLQVVDAQQRVLGTLHAADLFGRRR